MVEDRFSLHAFCHHAQPKIVSQSTRANQMGLLVSAAIAPATTRRISRVLRWFF